MQHDVMIPLDGSSFAEAALPQAIALAARMHATLHLVRVQQYHTVHAGAILQVEPEAEDALKFYLDTTIERIRRFHAGPIESYVLDGPAVDALERFVTARRIGLVVLSSHGRRGPARLRLGSVTDALLQRLRVPMLVVRPPADEVDAQRITPIAPGCREVLLALDGSALSASMLPTAEALAAMWHVPLMLVTIVQPPVQMVYAGVDTFTPSLLDPVELHLAVDDAQENLAHRAASLLRRGVDVRTLVEVASSVAGGLRAVAARTPGAILAIATHGESGLRRMMRGSVADNVLHRSPVPVLVWRPSAAEVGQGSMREVALSKQ
jgi:nucleotide-binding universal stress UspA family protein